MKKKATAMVLATTVISCAAAQHVAASGINGRVHISTRVQASQVQAAINSVVRLGSVKLKGSNLGSTLNVNNQVVIGGPTNLQRGAQVRIASLDLDNARIGGTTNLQMNVNVHKGVYAGQDSEIGLGGVEIGTDDIAVDANYVNNVVGASENEIGNRGKSHRILPEIPTQHAYRLVGEKGWIADAFDNMLTSDEDELLYDELYYNAMEYNSLAQVAKVRAEIAYEKGNLELAEIYKKEYWSHVKIYNAFESAALDVFNNQLDSAAAKVRTVYEGAALATKIVANVALPGPAAFAVDMAVSTVDAAVNVSDPDISNDVAAREFTKEIILSVILELSPLDSVSGDLVGKNDIIKSIASNSDKKINETVMRMTHAIVKEEVSIGAKKGADMVEAYSTAVSDALLKIIKS